MKVAMVKHNTKGKVYWFSVPEDLVGRIKPGDIVICDTKNGKHAACTVVCSDIEFDDVKDVLASFGATLPLRKIERVLYLFDIDKIIIDPNMAKSRPRDSKLAERFLELYHSGRFLTNVEVDEDGVLRDGYTAYLVAKFLGHDMLPVNIRWNKPAEDWFDNMVKSE